MRSEPADPARLRAFHERLSLAGDPPNTLLSLPRDTPTPPPTQLPEA